MRYAILSLIAILIGGCGLFTPRRPVGAIILSKKMDMPPQQVMTFREEVDTARMLAEEIEKARKGEISSVVEAMGENYRVYYIQIYASASEKFARKVRDKFEKEFKGLYSATIKYIPPLYRVRVGGFHTMDEAKKALKEIKSASEGYRDAFIVEEIDTGQQ